MIIRSNMHGFLRVTLTGCAPRADTQQLTDDTGGFTSNARSHIEFRDNAFTIRFRSLTMG